MELSVIQTKIEDYLDHLHDLDYIETILKAMDIAQLYDAIVGMLRSGDPALITDTDLFIRDVMLLPLPASVTQFRAGFTASPIVEQLHTNLFAPQYVVRYDAVYTIGKVMLQSSLGVLERAFQHYLDSDPRLLPGLLFELRWLGNADIWPFIEKMCRSTSYLTRWAALSTYVFDGFRIPQNSEDAQYSKLQRHYLELLQSDPNPHVSAEADYKLREFELTQNTQTLGKAARKKAKKAFATQTPPILFDLIQLHLDKYLYDTGKEVYTVADFERFVADYRA